MNDIAINQIFSLLLQGTIVAALLLFLFRLRSIFGLGLLFTALGVFQFMQVFLIQTVIIEILPNIFTSPGSIVLFVGGLFAILVVYIREDALEARKVIYAILFANLTVALLQFIFANSLKNSDTINVYNIPSEFFTQSARTLVAGTIVLFIDAFVIILVYEFISRFIRPLYFRMAISMIIVLSLDTVLFSLGAFAGKPEFMNILISGMIFKPVAAIFYSALFSIYLYYFDKKTMPIEKTADSFSDIFSALTFRQKYERVYKLTKDQHIELQQSEERFRQLIEQASDALFLSDFEGNMLQVNKHSCQNLGYTRKELLSMKVGDLDSEFITLEKQRAFWDTLVPGKTAILETTHKRKDGSFFPVEISVGLIEIDDKKRILGFARDITERKTQQIALVASEQKFANIFNSVADGIVYISKKGRVIDVNTAIHQMTAVPKEDIVGKHALDIARKFLSIKDLPILLKPITNMLAGKSIEPFELNFNNRILEISVPNTKNEFGYVGVFRDITERKLAEYELSTANEFTEKIIETSTAIIIGLDKNHLIKIFNAGASAISGYNKSEVMGKDWYEIFFPKELLTEMNQVWKVAWGRPTHSYTNAILSKSGEERIISFQTTGIYDHPDENKHLIISIGEDITAFKKAEEKVKETAANLNAVIENRVDSIWSLDKDLNYLIFNSHFAKDYKTIFQIELKKGLNAMDILSPELRVFWESKYKAALKGEEVVFEFSQEIRGSNHFYQTSLNPIVENDKITGISAISIDITKLKQVEEELKKHHNHLEELIRERTTELDEKNKRLEKINKLFVGRELRMRELKEEIKKLRIGE